MGEEHEPWWGWEEGVQPRVSSAAGPAPATGTTQARAADSTLMQRREGSEACQLVLRKDQHIFLCFKPEKHPRSPSTPTSGNKFFFRDGPDLPLLSLDLPFLGTRCWN